MPAYKLHQQTEINHRNLKIIITPIHVLLLLLPPLLLVLLVVVVVVAVVVVVVTVVPTRAIENDIKKFPTNSLQGCFQKRLKI